MDVICQFNTLKPPKFQGGADPLKYEEWIHRLENLFEIMESPERYKVALASYQFEGEAEYWWGTVKPRGGEDPPDLDSSKGINGPTVLSWRCSENERTGILRVETRESK